MGMVERRKNPRKSRMRKIFGRTAQASLRRSVTGTIQA
jgi:hypothetical protein